MNKKLNKICMIMSAILLLITGCSGGVTINTDPDNKAPDFELEQMNGENMSLSDTEGKVRLVYFYFSSCTTGCIPATYMLYQVQEQLKEKGVFGTDTAILSITFDPERDTPERLEEFSRLNHADLSGWHFLRSDEQYSRDLAFEYKVGVTDVGDGQFAHGNIFWLVNQEGYVEPKYYNANDLDNLDATKIVNDIMHLLKYKG